jgi:uncharacterized membrane protein
MRHMKSPKLRWICLVLLLAAMAGDLWLLVPALLERPIAGCGNESGCGAVTASSWAYWLGVPVSLPALLAHLGAAVLLGLNPAARTARRVLAALLFSMVGAGLWFLGIQMLVIGRYCPFCIAIHALGAASALIWLTSERAWRERAGMALAAAGLLLLAGGQILRPTDLVAVKKVATNPKAAAADDSPGYILLAGDLNAPELPVLGNPKAPRVACLLFDFTCPNCRKSHRLAESWVAEQQGRAALVLFPVALCSACNPYISNTLPEHKDACDYARLALALWNYDPAMFHRFCQTFLGEEPAAPPVAQARDWAAAQVGGEQALNALLENPAIAKRLTGNHRFFASCVRASERVDMPKLVTDRAITSGAPDGIRGYAPYLEEVTGAAANPR